MFRKVGQRENIAIPNHRQVAEGTLRGLLKKMRIAPETFLRLARKY